MTLEPELLDDPWYRLMNRTWILQQLPLGIIFFYLGGWAWVVWGISARVVVSVTGHWIVTYYTHNPGPGRWIVPSVGVQASNLPGLGLLSMGECWLSLRKTAPVCRAGKLWSLAPSTNA